MLNRLLHGLHQTFRVLNPRPHCLLCHGPIETKPQQQPMHLSQIALKHSELSGYVCACCLPAIAQQGQHRCVQCGLRLGPRPVAFGWVRCRHCQQHEMPYANTIVCGDYCPPLDEWVTALKYGRQWTLAKAMAAWLHDTLKHHNAPMPDVICPVPMTPARLKKRGYNQTLLIAKALGKRLNIRVEPNVLMKVFDTPAQAGLNRESRMHALRGAFAVRKALPSGLRVAVVDDVITTGSTVQACWHALRKAGAGEVQCWAVFRTPE